MKKITALLTVVLMAVFCLVCSREEPDSRSAQEIAAGYAADSLSSHAKQPAYGIDVQPDRCYYLGSEIPVYVLSEGGIVKGDYQLYPILDEQDQIIALLSLNHTENGGKTAGFHLDPVLCALSDMAGTHGTDLAVYYGQEDTFACFAGGTVEKLYRANYYSKKPWPDPEDIAAHVSTADYLAHPLKLELTPE
ncbi:MAG: hypothetical protein IJD13_05755 [Oscillospiraceae bacterium]|nr:hypothetical protein [Oscillospiraceae bacterium]